jgi:signal recognition particle GTPase
MTINISTTPKNPRMSAQDQSKCLGLQQQIQMFSPVKNKKPKEMSQHQPRSFKNLTKNNYLKR